LSYWRSEMEANHAGRLPWPDRAAQSCQLARIHLPGRGDPDCRVGGEGDEPDHLHRDGENAAGLLARGRWFRLPDPAWAVRASQHRPESAGATSTYTLVPGAYHNDQLVTTSQTPGVLAMLAEVFGR